MSEQISKIGFGSINDNDDSLKGKSGGGVFGLNETAFITKLEHNPNAGKDNSPGDAVDIHVMIGEREFRRRIFNVTRVFDKDGNELTNENDPEYIKIYNADMAQAMAVVIHAVKAVGVTQQQIDNALATPPTNFADWAKIVTGLVPSGFNKKPVDVFLEYQWTIGANNDRTYLEIPKNMKGGRFLCPSVKPVGAWKIENDWTYKTEDGIEKQGKGLRYVDNAGNVHPFERSQNYMESNKANQQIEGQSVGQSALGAIAGGPQSAVSSSWDN